MIFSSHVLGQPSTSHKTLDILQTDGTPPEQEAYTVERLHRLLEGYYAELQESARILSTAEELDIKTKAG